MKPSLRRLGFFCCSCARGRGCGKLYLRPRSSVDRAAASGAVCARSNRAGGTAVYTRTLKFAESPFPVGWKGLLYTC